MIGIHTAGPAQGVRKAGIDEIDGYLSPLVNLGNIDRDGGNIEGSVLRGELDRIITSDVGAGDDISSSVAPSPIATRYPIPVVPFWTYRSELMNEYSGTAVVGSSGTEGASPLEHAPRHKHIASPSAKKESFLILNTSNIKRKYLHFIGQV